MTAALLREALAILRDEEQLLAALVGLAREEQRALIAADYPRVEAVSQQMLEAVRRIEAREADRLNLLRTVGLAFHTLDDLAAHAENLGVEGFAEVRERLAARALELREVQEANARLVLNAMRVRDRWAAIVAGHTSPTYSPTGQAAQQEGPGFVSKTA